MTRDPRYTLPLVPTAADVGLRHGNGLRYPDSRIFSGWGVRLPFDRPQ